MAVCQNFRDVTYDGHHGRLPGAEITDKLNELGENAVDASTEVQSAYAEVLAAAARGDLGISSEARQDMLAAWRAVEIQHSEEFS